MPSVATFLSQTDRGHQMRLGRTRSRGRDQARNSCDAPVDLVARDVIGIEPEEIGNLVVAGAAVRLTFSCEFRIVEGNGKDARALPCISAALQAVTGRIPS